MLERVANNEREVQAKLATLSSASEPALPMVDEIMTYVVDVEARIKDDPTTAREALRQVLIDGKITLKPQPEGSCQAASMLIVGRLTWKTRRPRSGRGSEVVEIVSCAGVLRGPYHDRPAALAVALGRAREGPVE